MEIPKVGDRLKRLREDLGMSQPEAAAAITRQGFRTTASNLSRIENGLVRSIDTAFLLAAANCFDVSLLYLTDGSTPTGARMVELAGRFERESTACAQILGALLEGDDRSRVLIRGALESLAAMAPRVARR